MKTITLDIASKESLLLDVQNNAISFKSGDADQRFCLALYEEGREWDIPAGAVLSVWYSGPGGEGSYSEVNGESAFSVSGNTVIITPAPEMLTASGSGLLCLAIHASNDISKVLWNLIYTVEGLPAANTTKMSTYFAAFSGLIKQAQHFISDNGTDSTLTMAGKAADAAATGATLAKKAPAGYGLGGKASSMQAGALSELTQTGWYCYGTSPTDNPCSGHSGLLRVEACDLMTVQTAYVSALSNDGNFNTKATRQRISGEDSFGQWEWENPPMTAGTPYRTTERYNGKPVYAKLVNIGALPSSASKYYSIGIDPNTYIIVDSSVRMQTSGTYTRTRTQDNMDYCFDVGSDGNYAMIVETTANFSDFTCDLTVKYIRK